jgi:hypothetical protein
MVVPDPPPPHDYQVGFAPAFVTNIWHSSTATVTQPGFVGAPVFTHDGRSFVAQTSADLNVQNVSELALVTPTGTTVRTVPFSGRFGVRGDGNRLTLLDQNGTLMTWDVDGTLGPPIATKLDGHARYAPDDQTLVFARGGQVVTMHDDGTNEEILVPVDASGPSFSWDGTRVVYIRSRTDVEAIDRTTHTIQTLFTTAAPQRVWSAAVTPDGAYVIALVGRPYAPFSIVRERIETAAIDVIYDHITSLLEGGELASTSRSRPTRCDLLQDDRGGRRSDVDGRHRLRRDRSRSGAARVDCAAAGRDDEVERAAERDVHRR